VQEVKKKNPKITGIIIFFVIKNFKKQITILLSDQHNARGFGFSTGIQAAKIKTSGKITGSKNQVVGSGRLVRRLRICRLG
jgi:hypothetical protein